MLTAGLGGVTRRGSAAISSAGRLLGVCEQERITRIRNAGFDESGLPGEAIDALLQRLGRSRDDIDKYVLAEAERDAAACGPCDRIDHHLAHASTAYRSSPFQSAAIIVCDHDAPKVSVWQGAGSTLTREEWPWRGPGFADVYSLCAQAFGFDGPAGDQRFEALARLSGAQGDDGMGTLLTGDGHLLEVAAGFQGAIEQRLPARAPRAGAASARLAATVEARLKDLFLELVARVREQVEEQNLCLGGSFFYHSSINTAVRRSGLFARVFTPVDPGNTGVAVGAALHADACPPSVASPFLGPSYAPDVIKETLDNCKLQYNWESEDDAIRIAVDALRQGTLVAWFDGAMEWGPRALGARCILANPFAPFVLENLNRFLKRREPWRGYALSGLDAAVQDHFDGPPTAPFMECDYRPRDPGRFKHALPSPEAAIRVQTVGSEAPPRFRRLLEAFGAAAGWPFLVNTSFNAFHEPMVCSPRDAVRVFYGSGVDVLILDQFVLRK
ncbi:MAG TPA: carbamoyltransferase C-terminal domain-containing protein [Vicinamibacterales bacterium]|jgi:carbamoyltransferase|nr:carbamoyltransferase C-terminal domain-containing protein [Vicinamibacterales bacterium]